MSRGFLVFVFSVLFLKSFPQNYPVQLSAQLVPPFSGYLPDYSSPGSQNFRLFILFTDFTKTSYNVKLKFKLSGQGINIQSKNYYYAGPFTLEPGIPLELSGSDLSGLLNSNNLDFSGISKYQYEQGKILPEGYYQLCVTAYDHNNPTDIQVSNESCAFAWMVHNDPPYLNFPACGSAVQVLNPQNVIFQWTPMNLASPNSAANTQYEFSLYQVQPGGNSPANVIQTLPPIYQYTTNLTTLNYGITEPVLNQGSQYVWRVKAIDLSGRDLFKNNGYSQLCTFTYGSLAQLLDSNSLRINLQGVPVTHRLGKFFWDSLSIFKTYKLRYRKKGTAAWFDDGELSQRYNFVPNLEPGTDYEGQVRGKTEDGSEGPWSNIATIHTPDKPVILCGQPNTTLLQNFKPLTKASNGMIWEVGQFEMVVTGLYNAQHPGGIYSGYGKVEVPFLLGMQMRCKFNNVVVNEQMQVVSGEVNVLTEGIEAWMSHFQYPPGWNQADTIKTGGDVNSVTTSGGQILVNGTAAGNTGENTVVTGTNGTNFFVSPNGSVTQENYEQGSPVTNVTSLKDSLATIEFTEHAQGVYGYDSKLISQQTAGEEKDYEVMPQGKSKYYVAYKLLVTGTEDKIVAKISSGKEKINLSSIKFKRTDGTIIPSTSVGNDSYEITLKGRLHLYSDGLWAFARSSNQSDTNYYPIGKINLVTIDKKIEAAVLVPVNNFGQAVDAVSIQNDLNNIYKKAGVEWQVTKASNLNVTGYSGDSLLRVNRSWLNTTYGSDLKNIINQFKAANPLQNKEASYLFLCDKSTNNELGYMALNKQFGFIFLNNNNKISLTAAHELGHGALVLEHPFESGNSGSSQNLMDYNNGDLFNHKQWVSIHDPNYTKNLINSLVQDEECGQYCPYQTADNITLFETLKMIKKCVNENKTMPVGYIPNSYYQGYRSKNVNLAGIQYDYIFIYKDLGSNTSKTSIIPKNNILSEVKQSYNAGTGQAESYGCIKVDNTLFIHVPANRKANMEIYLTSPEGKNMILFVNGYRSNISPSFKDKPNSMNKVFSGDVYDYWSGLDAEFMNRIGTKNAVYADGHHSVSTANHLSQAAFLASMESSFNPSQPTILNKVPNVTGFSTRYNYGKVAGSDLISKINTGAIVFNKATDSLDIVAHSMGFAYAQGMLEVLHNNGIKFGRYYILAPENACSGNVTMSWFTEVWQYGSDEVNHSIKKQDGVAPQCKVLGLPNTPGSKGGRVYIPSGVTQDFLHSHFIDNYHWIFNRLPSTDKGYVKAR